MDLWPSVEIIGRTPGVTNSTRQVASQLRSHEHRIKRERSGTNADQEDTPQPHHDVDAHFMRHAPEAIARQVRRRKTPEPIA